MTISKRRKAVRITPNTRVILAIGTKGEIIASEVVPYRGGRVRDYYRHVSAVERKLKERCKEDDTHCRVYSGTAKSVENFLRIFPEVASPF